MTFVENKKADTEDKNRNLYCTENFSQFTYWNYDKVPSKNDALVAALDWIDIAEAVSSFFANSFDLSFVVSRSILMIFLNNFQLHSPET